MRSPLALVILATFIYHCEGAVNYCGAKMCGYTNAHTFCQYPDGPSPSCIGYIQVPLTSEEKIRILIRLNRRRADVASGRLRDFPTAGDMLKLRWVEELAREAQRWADQCRPPETPDEHDACRDLYSVSVGQNVASVVGEAPGLRAESMVDMWYMQSIHYKGNVSSYQPPVNSINYYGDFAQIVWSYTYMVGCGRSRFMMHLKGRLRTVERLVCNFAPRGPMSDQPIWIQDEPAARCPPRSLPDTDFKALCAYQPYLIEVPTNMTTIEDNTLLNTIFEIEMNKVLNYAGSLDEVYLTKIAIATLHDKAKTEPYNTFQKREVPFDTMTGNSELNNHLQESDKAIHVIRIADTTRAKLTPSTVKAKLMGRYKSYNADDLMDVGGVQITQNYEIPADLPKEEREFDADYQYINAYEGDSDSTKNVVRSSDVSSTPVYKNIENINKANIPAVSSTPVYKSIGNLNNPTEITYPLNSLTLINVTYGFGEEYKMGNSTINDTIGDNNTSLVLPKEDEFLSDPEIVRDLELALRQMEQSMETTTVTPAVTIAGSEKVKRDLREISKEVIEDKQRDFGTPPPYVQDLNMTMDKAPMLNMIMKYIPYLKTYKKDLMGQVTNKAVIVSPPCFVSVIAFVTCLM